MHERKGLLTAIIADIVLDKKWLADSDPRIVYAVAGYV